jgi:hypothetical protein
VSSIISVFVKCFIYFLVLFDCLLQLELSFEASKSYGVTQSVRIFGDGTEPNSTAIIIGRKTIVVCEHSLQPIRKLSEDGNTVTRQIIGFN